MADPGSYADYAFTAELYDHVVPYRERQDIAFFVEAASNAGGPVLELGCGTGRVLIPTARAGVPIVGFDLSPQMLEACRRRLDAEPAAVRSRVRLVQGDMRDFELGEAFNLVTMPFRPFQHLLTVEDQLSCLGSVRRHLVDGGALILDLFNPSLEALTSPARGEECGHEPEFVMEDGRRVRRCYKVLADDLIGQTRHVEMIYHVTHPDGRTERLVDSLKLRYLFRFEAEHLLARAGFAVEHAYGDYNKTPLGSTCPSELVFVARRTGP
jgi:SAM-dependent methyltransferase